VPNYVDADSDDDTITDKVETSVDFDDDGAGNYVDFDSDNDCILDKIEAPSKTQLDASRPARSADDNCPGAAPTCDTTIGQCVTLPPGVPTSSAANLNGGGGLSCSTHAAPQDGGGAAVIALGALIGAALARRRRAG
jgi:MYXO-CTERM domain-containing protein